MAQVEPLKLHFYRQGSCTYKVSPVLTTYHYTIVYSTDFSYQQKFLTWGRIIGTQFVGFTDMPQEEINAPENIQFSELLSAT